MALVPFNELLAEAERGRYAVGYFESWNLESLLAVADAGCRTIKHTYISNENESHII